MFSDRDKIQIKSHGLTTEAIEKQVTSIKSGMVYSNLKEAATIGNGILKIENRQATFYINLFEAKRDALSMVKFVPASGAATRMFKFLFQFLKDYQLNHESIEDYAERSGNLDIMDFFQGLEKLPFYGLVISKIHGKCSDYNQMSYEERCVEFVKTMLDEAQLNYSFYPKGLLPFHKYQTHVATAFEEHFFEAAFYASSNNLANLHLTISKAHQGNFQKELNHIIKDVERKTGHKFNISFSNQKSVTDTIALTLDHDIYREPDGSILFRPSGHGALLENLNDLDHDIIFIKNIDNLVVKDQLEKVCNYKKILAGILLETQEQVFRFLKLLDTGNLDDNDINAITSFMTKTLNTVVAPDFEFSSLESKIFYLRDKLNRPIRVCGMVKNVGEPGGGPFWVTDPNGSVSLQIIEFAQIDMSRPDQKDIVASATHFNPTDLVCGIKNYQGEPFNLMKYVDHKAAFITDKTQAGTHIKALELPGLWNGSMAFWNSIFVEVPLNTFNPVKTVNDLLRRSHQVEQ